MLICYIKGELSKLMRSLFDPVRYLCMNFVRMYNLRNIDIVSYASVRNVSMCGSQCI